MNKLIFGVMTGTSMDAIDVCLLEIKNGKPIELKDFESKPISSSLKEVFSSLLKKGPNELEKSQIASIQFSLKVSKIVNSIINRHNLNTEEILGIGVHGQTVRHNPEKSFTLQLCNPSIISEKTKLTVISDFRSKDIAAGGEGAPLAPLFHHEIVKKYAPCAVVNIGGIANISVILKCNIKGTKISKGFDTGPGNCYSDLWCKKNFNRPYDKNGDLAREGKLNDELLNKMLLDPYFAKKAPKSTGLHYFDQRWLNCKLQHIRNRTHKINIQATLIELTARSITNNIPKFCKSVYVCGGGAKNSYLIERLNHNSHSKIYSSDIIGWDPQTIESACFAWLAFKTLNNEKHDLKSITGSKNPVKLGNITFY